jgi:hypothetical protein
MENWVGSLFSTRWHALFESTLGCSRNSNSDKGHFAGSPENVVSNYLSAPEDTIRVWISDRPPDFGIPIRQFAKLFWLPFRELFHHNQFVHLGPFIGPYRNVWSAAELQAKNRERQVGLR